MYASITPQAIFSPDCPEGCVVKSSFPLWMMIDFPIISEIEIRGAQKDIHA